MNEHPSPEFEKELRETFHAPRANPAFVHDLRATLLERATMKTQTRTFPRLAWGIVLAILLIGLLVASPQVAEALNRLLAYLPGIGYVQGDSLRTLTAPVVLEKDGVKLTIEKGAADSQRTVLLGHIEGYTPARYSEKYCDEPAQLILPDGRTLGQTQSESSSMNSREESLNGSYYIRYVFEAMPAGELEATLEIPCLMYDDNFRDWRLDIPFTVADDTEIMPVIELPPAPTDLVTAAASPGGSSFAGFSILLESESPLPDGYILSGSYQWTDPRFDMTDIQILDPKITDANGQAISFVPVDPSTPLEPTLKKIPFAFQITGKEHAWPLTVAVDTVTVNLPEEATFQFDAGANPQVGQKWDVNIDVPVAGHIIHVQTIEVISGRTPAELGFNFTMIADFPVMGASIHDAQPVIGNGGGGGGGGGGGDNVTEVGPFTYGWAQEGYSPAGVKTFVVSNVAVMFDGPWQVTWQPTAR